MVAPRVRIDPSGPIGQVDDEALAGLAGAHFQALPLVITNPPNEYIGDIPPTTSPTPIPFTIVRKGVDIPQPPGDAAGFFPIGAGVVPDDFSMGVGKWLVECELGVGYATNGPSNAAEVGVLLSFFSLVRDDGSVTANTDPVRSPIPRSGLIGSTAGSVRSVKMRFMLHVSQNDIDSNNGKPIRGFTMTTIRVNAVNPLNGPLISGEGGEINFTSDTKLTISRFR